MSEKAAVAPIVEMKSITKDFPSVRALDDVSIAFRPGEVHGLIGENGAGKSTLMRILCGVKVPTTGELQLRGESVRIGGPADAQRRGISMIHQELNVVEELSVAENIMLGHEPTRGGLIQRSEMATKASELLEGIGCRIDPWRLIKNLSIAEQQMVEIAKALSHKAEVLIMDEPTAVLTQREVALLMKLIRDLRERGVAIIYISHILPEVLDICDRVTVLRDGAVVHRFDSLDGVTEHDLANTMVGREMSDQFPARTEVGSEVVFEAQDITVPGHVNGVSFAVRKGEIFGFGGLIGAGRTELAEAIACLRPRTSGTVRVNGEDITARTAREAVQQGISYLSEDRRGTGLVMGMNIIENTTLVSLRNYSRLLIRFRAEREATERHVRDLATKIGRLEEDVQTLSGGNQQKVALAKWLETKPKVLILDEPTRGIDVGAKAEIYRLIHDLTAQGMICLVISSEMNELLGLCHRIAVMRDGELRGVLDGTTATDREVMRVAAGVEEVGVSA
jgi:ribose transport system ATP-binding protein